MNTNSPGDQNVERLLAAAYDPEPIDPEFLHHVHAQLIAEAAERRRANGRRRAYWTPWLAAASIVGMIVMPMAIFRSSPERPVAEPEVAKPRPAQNEPPWSEKVTPLARQNQPALERLQVGDTLVTKTGEKKLVQLPDDSTLALNQETRVKLESDRHVTLCKGQVYVQVAPRSEDTNENRFVVQSGKKTVTARGTRFGVSSATECCSVVVTQGKVNVSGMDAPLAVGETLGDADECVTPAPRATHILAWARELLSPEPLVPASTFAGGALVAKTTEGEETRLSLRKYHTDVHVEDGFARTTIDQTYFNESFGRLEGTFHFPLPPDASLSRLAMYVDGTRMEGGMVERDYGRQVFEEIVRKQQDPALLEWVDGSTFKMRVFPLEARQEKRIILSYTQKLPQLYGKATYRFPAGHSLGDVAQWTFAARVKDGVPMTWASPSHKMTASNDKNDLLLSTGAVNVKLDRDVVLELSEKGSDANDLEKGAVLAGVRVLSPFSTLMQPVPQRGEQVHFASTDHDGVSYLGLRYRPELPPGETAKRQKRDWVILFESSAERNPLLARTQIDIVRTLLENTEHDDTFSVLTANTRANVLTPEPLAASPENVRAVVAQLDDTHLLGALDLDAGLMAAEPLLKEATNPYLLHVGGALPKLGERNAEKLLERLPDGARYIGVGVGKRWNRQFMKSAAERTGGYVTQINPDEPVTWRAFDLLATLNTPRLLDIKVADPAGKVQFLTYDSLLAQGEDLCAITRTETKDSWPRSVVVTGKLDGKPYRRELPVDKVTPFAGYLPRTWGRLEIDRLLAEGTANNKQKIVDLSKKLYVMSPFTSLLVLETEEMYARYKVDRGRKDHWAAYVCPEKIPVYYEPAEGPPVVKKHEDNTPATTTVVRPTREQVLRTIVLRHETLRQADEVTERSGRRRLLALVEADKRIPGSVSREDLAAAYDQATRLSRLSGIDGIAFSTDGARIASGSGDRTVRLWDAETAKGWAAQDFSTYSYFAKPRWHETTSGEQIPLLLSSRTGGPVGTTWMADGSVRTLESRSSTPIDFTERYLRQLHGVPTYQVPVGSSLGLANQDLYILNGRLDETKQRLFGFEWGVDRLSELDATHSPRSWNFNTNGAMAGAASDYGLPIIDGFVAPTRLHSFAPTNDFDGSLGARVVDESGLMWEQTELLGEMRSNLLGNQLGYFPLSNAQFVKNPSLIHTRPARASVAVTHGNGLARGLYALPSPAPTDVFRDLLIYAPGLNTMPADIYAVLEAEADAGRVGNPSHERKSKVADRARQLIERARAAGWFTITLPAEGDSPALTLTCDGQGRYRCERVLPWGLREIIICDGKTLLHLYPELGLGARRTVSRFHRNELAQLVPWLVPAVEDLARGANLESPDERTVLVVPHQGKYSLRLTFAPDGTLAARTLIEKKGEKVAWKQELATEGLVRLIDAESKKSGKRLLVRKPADTFKLTPEGENLVILPLPFRTESQVRLENVTIEYMPPARLPDDAAMAHLAALVGSRSPDLAAFLDSRFFRRGDLRPGLHVLLASTGQVVEPGPMTHLQHPRLTAYMHQATPSPGSISLARIGWDDQEDLFGQLTPLHQLQVLALNSDIPNAEQEKALMSHIRKCRMPIVLESLAAGFCNAQHDGFKDRAAFRLRVLDELAAATKDMPELNYAIRTEAIRCLNSSGAASQPEVLTAGAHWKPVQQLAARERFKQLHAEMVSAGRLPPIDATVRQAFNATEWEKWARATADDLLCRDMSMAVVALSAQCRQLGDAVLADALLDQVLQYPTDAAEKRSLRLAAIAQFCQANQLARAESVLRELLVDPADQCKASVWRFAAHVATLRGDKKDTTARLETALALSWEKRDSRSTLIFSKDYETLLGWYGQLAAEKNAPGDATARVLRAIERWRLLDPTAPAAERAAHVLVALGETDLAWDYLTTWLGRETGSAAEWRNAATWLQQVGAGELAERANTAASTAEGK